jgi:hypothetical protein
LGPVPLPALGNSAAAATKIHHTGKDRPKAMKTEGNTV